ncbi:MAG TPA: precorrin-3B synthase [Methylocella sp.]|nr:precorrin-3B synthase [Methylocella sp.]
MTNEASLRKGWCPSIRRPMLAKDGLIVRVRVLGGIIAAAAMKAMARAGLQYGNGTFDLSMRGNLQIRGVTSQSLPYLIEALGSAGLVDQGIAPIQNIALSPLAGLDGRHEARDAALALEAMLAAGKDLDTLPAKFSFLIDDGAELSLSSLAADIRFDWSARDNAFTIGIGGSADDASPLGICSASDIPEIAMRLAHVFLRLVSLIEQPPRRMRDLTDLCGAQTIAREAGLSLTDRQDAQRAIEPSPIGLMSFHGIECFGMGVAFGQLNSSMLEAAAAAAETFGASEIRLTPCRALLIPDIREGSSNALGAFLAGKGFITGRTDSRLAVSACGGAINCERGTTDTRADALAIAPIARKLRQSGIALHISGCRKRCARPAALFTLEADQGLYKLVAPPSFGDEESANQPLTAAQAYEKLALLAAAPGIEDMSKQP